MGEKTVNTGISQGFSVVELFLTTAIIGILCGMAIYVYNNLLPSIRADSALQFFEAQLRQAREISIDQRRNIQVTFQGTGEMVTVEQNENPTAATYAVTSTTTLSDYTLNPNQMVYIVLGGVPDTPDGFGNSTAVNFNCGGPVLPCTITFQSDGSVVDHTGAYIDGTLFMGSAGNTLTARAITILGTTGRIKGYRYNGNAWF